MGYNNNDLKHSGLYDRVQKLLVSYEWSDCTFLVSGKHFKAHRLILGISSPVFEAMLYGPLSTNENIEITDIGTDIFQLLLNFIYTDKVQITSIEQGFELLYASRKYLLDQLTEICIEYVQTNISIENVITVLNYPAFMQDQKLISFALKLFCEHADYLLEENKSQISYSCMRTILESEKMNILEKDLIKHVFEWTQHCCEDHNILDSIENRRDILTQNGLFHLLRFISLSLEDFREIVTSDCNLLMLYESENIEKILKDPKENIVLGTNLVSSNSAPRDKLKLHWCLCHRSPLRPVAPVVINSHNHILHSRIKPSKSVFITSLCIPTRMAPVINYHNNTAKAYSEQFSVSLICESDNSIIRKKNFMSTVEYDSTIDIVFSEPCLLKRDVWYRIAFVWPCNRQTYSYIVEYRDRHYSDHKVSFEFDDLSSGSFLGGLKYCL